MTFGPSGVGQGADVLQRHRHSFPAEAKRALGRRYAALFILQASASLPRAREVFRTR